MYGFTQVFKKSSADCMHTDDGKNADLHDQIMGGDENEAGRKQSWQAAKDAGVTGDALALLG